MPIMYYEAERNKYNLLLLNNEWFKIRILIKWKNDVTLQSFPILYIYIYIYIMRVYSIFCILYIYSIQMVHIGKYI